MDVLGKDEGATIFSVSVAAFFSIVPHRAGLFLQRIECKLF